MMIRIKGIPGFWEDADLMDLASPFGHVFSAHIVIDPITQKSKRFGFVQMRNPTEGSRLIEIMNGKSVREGQTLKLEAVERPHHPKY